MEKIDKPKVFISYAWGTEDYKDKVLSFATDLIHSGVDVELDRWSLKEGFDSFAFMEQSVTDPTISNVIILLDPIYAKKADARAGGVGTETQIISPEIYNNTRQEKFIPVVFERNEDGSVPKPSFLKGLLHFDLTNDELYSSEFERLVKRLYGIEVIKKPELGPRPAWVDQEPIVNAKTRISFDALKENQPDRVKKERFISFLNDIRTQIVEYKDNSENSNDLLYNYEKMQISRDMYLLLLKRYTLVDGSVRDISSFFEETKAQLKASRNGFYTLGELLLNEMFIYSVAWFYKAKDYDALANIFCKTYFVMEYGTDEGQSFEVFRVNNHSFDNAVIQRDKKNYFSGIANWWIEHINTEICSLKEFVFADLLCFNASILIESSKSHYWFPITYVYDGEDHNSLRLFANRLRSRENLDDASVLFGFSDANAFRSRFKELEAPTVQNEIKRYGYPRSFDVAPFLGDFIKADELGTKR